MATNDVLDRLDAMLAAADAPMDHSKSVFPTPSRALSEALRNAAPALIRLARAVLDVDDWTTKTDYEMKLACNEKIAAIKALGEVRL